MLTEIDDGYIDCTFYAEAFWYTPGWNIRRLHEMSDLPVADVTSSLGVSH